MEEEAAGFSGWGYVCVCGDLAHPHSENIPVFSPYLVSPEKVQLFILFEFILGARTFQSECDGYTAFSL